MNTSKYRMHIWVDEAGMVTGTSYELREQGRIVAVHVMPDPGPFESPAAQIAELLADMADRYGVRLRFF
jgi:hypothetical protein